MSFFAIVVVAIAGVWTALSMRARRRDRDWSPKRGLVALGISAVVTVFLAVPISPKEGEATPPLAHKVALWITLWLVIAGAIRLVTLIRLPHRGGPQAP